MIDWSQWPDAESVHGRCGGAWVVKGTRIPVQAIIDNARDLDEAAAMIDYRSATGQEPDDDRPRRPTPCEECGSREIGVAPVIRHTFAVFTEEFATQPFPMIVCAGLRHRARRPLSQRHLDRGRRDRLGSLQRQNVGAGIALHPQRSAAARTVTPLMHETPFKGIDQRIRRWRERRAWRKVDAEYRAFVLKLTALQDDAARLRLYEAQGHIGAAMRDITWQIARARTSE